MNKSYEVLKSIYKPYRYTIRGKVMILETTSGDFVVKPQKKDLRETFKYLKSRSFVNFPDLIDDSREGVVVSSYIQDISMPKEQRAQDMILLVAQLHQKTVYFKTVNYDVYQEIYESVLANINYLRHYFEELFEMGFTTVYNSPSQYLFMRNCSKILSSLDFAQKELDSWFELVKNETKQRVCYIHNNLSLDHFLKNEQDYLISWDESKIDTPVLDLVHFYQTEYFDLDFQTLFQKYQERFPWREDELKLFFILISLPRKFEIKTSEFQNCKNVRECLDYLYKTEELIRPYYTEEQE